jgi:hypothetical protein
MPVDLSRIGLEGIETAQRTLNSMAQREALASQTEIAEAEEARKVEDREIDQWAAGALDSIGKGSGLPAGGSNSLVSSDSDDPAAVFDAIGQRYLRAGAPKRGKEFIEGGMELRKKQFDIDKGRDDQAQTRLKNMLSASDWVARNIGENENEYALFLRQLEDPNNPVAKILGEENVTALKNTPWSPDLANYFRTKALSIKDQAQLSLTERGQNRADRNADIAQARYKALEELGRANLEERRRENARKEKADGPDVSSAPTEPQRKAAISAIVNNVKFFDGITPPEPSKGEEGTPERAALENMATDIVGRAKIIVSENKGLTFDQAIEQAVAEADAAGDFSILEPAEEGFNIFGIDTGIGGKPAVTGYKRKGTRPDNPIPLPADKSKWVKGRYYMKNGKVGRYGTDFN